MPTSSPGRVVSMCGSGGGSRGGSNGRDNRPPAPSAARACSGRGDAAPYRRRWADPESSPPWLRQRRGDPPRPVPGMPEREPDDPLLDQQRELVGHHRPPALTRPEHLQPLAVDLALAAVIGAAM